MRRPFLLIAALLAIGLVSSPAMARVGDNFSAKTASATEAKAQLKFEIALMQKAAEEIFGWTEKGALAAERVASLEGLFSLPTLYICDHTYSDPGERALCQYLTLVAPMGEGSTANFPLFTHLIEFCWAHTTRTEDQELCWKDQLARLEALPRPRPRPVYAACYVSLCNPVASDDPESWLIEQTRARTAPMQCAENTWHGGFRSDSGPLKRFAGSVSRNEHGPKVSAEAGAQDEKSAAARLNAFLESEVFDELYDSAVELNAFSACLGAIEDDDPARFRKSELCNLKVQLPILEKAVSAQAYPAVADAWVGCLNQHRDSFGELYKCASDHMGGAWGACSLAQLSLYADDVSDCEWRYLPEESNLRDWHGFYECLRDRTQSRN